MFQAQAQSQVKEFLLMTLIYIVYFLLTGVSFVLMGFWILFGGKREEWY